MLQGLEPYFNRGTKQLILKKSANSWYWVSEKIFTVIKKKCPIHQSTNGTTPKKITSCNIHSARGGEHKFRNSDVSKKIKSKFPTKADKNSIQSANFSQNNIENLCPEEEKSNAKCSNPTQLKLTNNSLFFTHKYNAKI